MRAEHGPVNVARLNSSRAALNVFIFRGAADATVAQENSRSGGFFTSAFIRHMFRENATLEELSSAIRSDLTKAGRMAERKSLDHGSELRITCSLTCGCEIINIGSVGTILSQDHDDNSFEISFRGYITTQWVSISDVPKLRDRNKLRAEEVQISPTENYLSGEYSRWSFSQSSTMCCSMMPQCLENGLVRCSHGRCFWAEEYVQQHHDSGSEEAHANHQTGRGEVGDPMEDYTREQRPSSNVSNKELIHGKKGKRRKVNAFVRTKTHSVIRPMSFVVSNQSANLWPDFVVEQDDTAEIGINAFN